MCILAVHGVCCRYIQSRINDYNLYAIRWKRYVRFAAIVVVDGTCAVHSVDFVVIEVHPF